jgi:outer membrane murein-binding lipoprotein Lpp
MKALLKLGDGCQAAAKKEELTLYVIQQQKQIDELEKKVNQNKKP